METSNEFTLNSLEISNRKVYQFQWKQVNDKSIQIMDT